jgi:predicted RecB family nuclease
MRKDPDGTLVYSPSDLVTYLKSPYAAWMERLRLERPGTVERDEETQDEKLIKEMGLEHEREWLGACLAKGVVVDIGGVEDGEKLARTREEMKRGTSVIYQASLRRDELAGYADFLERVEGESSLGAFHYEVADTKLARSLKPDYVIQLCAYAEMLEEIQGRRPQKVHIILGTKEKRSFRTDDYFWAYLAVKRGFLEIMAEFDPGMRPPPEPKDDHGRWTSYVESWIKEHDHLAQVANVSRGQIVKLGAAGIETMSALAGLGSEAKVSRIADPQFLKLRTQARLQKASSGKERPEYELVPPDAKEPRRGLAVLPPPSSLDAWIDFEGYPLEEGGLYYLFGATTVEAGKPRFWDWWAHDRAAEKKAFEEFVDFIHARWKADPTMHLYHYAAYEVTALRNLMGLYGTREDEVDDLLRAEVFVDLLPVVRQGVRIGTPSYSLKDIERLYRDRREGEVATAGESISAYHHYRQTKDQKVLDQIRDYNKDDCDSTRSLVEWLRTRQGEAGIAWLPPIKQAKKPPNPNLPDVDKAAAVLAAELKAEIPADRETWGPEKDRFLIQELLAGLLEFHRREQKPMFWAKFDRHEMTHDELAEDVNCLGRLTLESAASTRLGGPKARSLGWWYRFDPDQDTKLDATSKCFFAHDLDVSAVIEVLNRDDGRVQVKLGPTAVSRLSGGVPPEVLSLIPDEAISQDTLKQAIFDIATEWRASRKLPKPVESILLRAPARVKGLDAGRPLLADGEDPTEGAVRLAALLDGTALCIQGPPGTGKTYTGVAMIRELVAKGCRVGVTSNSHKAIEHVLRKLSEKTQGNVPVLKVGRDDPASLREDCANVTWESDSATAAAMTEFRVVGGTAWFFAREDVAGSFDYLFVDEAGQFSLANCVAVGRAAQNLVLLGDQLQLGQPIQGSHPGESGTSALDYVLGGQHTIKPDFGIFLEKTRRLHPMVCRFLSAAVYENRLVSVPGNERRVVRVPPRTRLVGIEAGLLFVPVEHDGNVQASDEEVAVIQQLFQELVGREWSDTDGVGRKITAEDILVVAPYNMQVRRLQAKLGRERVGSVDKFQGQEAPIVIVSMCASDGDSSPRGIEFLFDKHRLNVAISRAQSLAIVVGSPALTRTRCGTVKQMELVNTFCRIVAEGGAVDRGS